MPLPLRGVAAAAGPPAVIHASRGRCWLGRVLRWAAAVGILAFLFLKLPASEVLATMAAAEPLPLVGSFLLTLLAQLAVAARLRRLIRPHDPRLTTLDLYAINLGALFYGLFLPVGNVTGLTFRFYRMARPERRYAATAAVLFLDRLIATLALVGLGVVAWLLELPSKGWPAFLMMAAVAAALTLLLAPVFVDLGAPGEDLRRRLARLAPRRLERMRVAVAAARSLPPATRWAIFALAFVAQVLGVAAYGLVALSVGLPISWMTLAWTRSAAIFLAILPITFAGLGVREGAFLALLTPYGVAGQDALAFSLLAFGTTVLGVAAVGGLVEAQRLLR